MGTANARVISTIGDLVAGALPAVPRRHSDKLRGSAPRSGSGQVLQMLTPMVRWDWPVALDGAMSYQQWAFSDAAPESLTPSAPFFQTSNSFSKAYLNFLGLIDPARFPMRPELESILVACKPPSSLAQDAPDGWARAPDATGITRWRLAYGVSDTPKAWVAANAGGAGERMTLQVPVTADTALALTDAGGASQSLPLQGKASEVIISARAWGQVRITPGAWFDGSLLTFARKGPFVAGVAPDQSFGSMLTGRVGTIIIAYNPSLTLSLPASAAADSGGALESAKAVEIGGFRFQKCVAGSPAAGAAGTIPYIAAAEAGPWIIGVMLEPFS